MLARFGALLHELSRQRLSVAHVEIRPALVDDLNLDFFIHRSAPNKNAAGRRVLSGGYSGHLASLADIAHPTPYGVAFNQIAVNNAH